MVYFATDGGILVGDAAQRNATADPANAARGFSRRVGDQVPVMVGGEACTAEELTAVLVTWVVNEVAAAEGAPPQHVVVTHPAGWGYSAGACCTGPCARPTSTTSRSSLSRWR
ncbi:hypothetical protein GCM10029964_022170 [Kibdelosporangium lantanae]